MRTATLRSEMIGAELRKHREATRMSQAEAAHILGFSLTKASRMESGERPQKVEDVAAALAIYRVTGQDREDLLTLTRSAAQAGFLHQHTPTFAERYATLRTLESRATMVLNFEPMIVPGLLQTVPYARAVMAEVGLMVDETVISERVASRIHRQSLLRQQDAPMYFAIIGEHALRSGLGGPEVMRGQLRYLVEAARLPRVSVRVVPQGAYGPGLLSHFLRLQFADRNTVILLTSLTSSLYLEDASDVGQYDRIISVLMSAALSEDDSTQLIGELAGKDLSHDLAQEPSEWTR